MSEDATEPLPCPRCGSDEISFGYSAPPLTGNVECHADDCGALAIVAGREDAAIAMWNAGRWNFRVTDRDECGLPIIQQDGPAPPQEPTR